MCTAVVGGSIHRAATRGSTASDQRSATPIRNHPSKRRREPFRPGALVLVSGFSVTLQNNRFPFIPFEFVGSSLSFHHNLSGGTLETAVLPATALWIASNIAQQLRPPADQPYIQQVHRQHA